MHKIHLADLKQWPERRLSQSVFYVLVALIVIVFGLFYTVGYEHPFDESPDFNAPMFTGTLISFIILLTIGAVAATVASAIRGARKSGRERVVNGVPAARIVLCVFGATLAVMIATFVFSPTGAMPVNGAQYTDALWLRMAEMFVDTSVLLLVVAVAAVAYAYAKSMSYKKK